MAFDAATDRRIQRMSCHKVAMSAMAPFPVTSKGEPAAAAENWKKVFIGLTDFLWEDVNKAGEPPPLVVASSGESDTVPIDAGPMVTLEQASKLADRLQEKSEGNDVLKNAIKLQFVKFGISPGPLLECVCKLTKPQADELVELVNKEG